MVDFGTLGTLFAFAAPPGGAIAVGGFLVKKVWEHDASLKAMDDRLERIESQVDKLVDHLINE